MVDNEGFPLEEIYKPPELNEVFNNLVSTMPSELLELVKNFVEKTLPTLIGIEGKLEVSVVLDANAVISQAINYIKKERMPLIIELSKTPFVKLYAPPLIYKETLYDEEKLKKIAKKKKVSMKKKISIDVLKEKIKEILSHIEIIAPEGYE